jgi:hypothetical protein
MSDFDDPELGRRLRAAAGSEPDLGGARAGLQRRVTSARRRRAAAVSGAAALVLVSAGTLAALATRDGGDRIETAAPASTLAPSTSAPNTTSAIAPSTSGPTTSAPATVTPTPTSTVVAVSPPESAASTSSTVPDSTSAPTAPPATTVPATQAPIVTTVPTTTPPATDEIQTYPSPGGSITVRLANGALSLLSVDEAPGYHRDIKVERADEVEVRFESEGAEYTIRIRIEDGHMVRDDPQGESEDDHSETEDH